MEDKKTRDTVKAKEKEMKAEKEAERQVRRPITASCLHLLIYRSAGYKESKTNGQLRPRRNDMRNLQRRCTGNVWSG